MFPMQVCQCPLTQPLHPQLMTLMKGKHHPVVEQRNSVTSVVMQPVTMLL